MISFPFEGILTTVQTLTATDQKTVDVPVTDRGYDSETLQEIYDSLYTDGIAQDITNCLKVSPGTGMNVIVSPGVCKSGGAFGIEKEQRTLAVQASHATLDRIDAVVARKDNNNTYRNVDLYVVQGTPEVSPKAPEPTRNESVYEIVLGHIFVARGTTSIASYRITDTRLDKSLCGLMQGRPGTDTTGIFDQYQSALDEFLSFVQSAIDETMAGNLQSQIDKIKGTFTVQKDTSNGNWVVKKYADNWCELYIRAMVPRESTEPFTIILYLPGDIKLKNMRVQITPCLNGWNLLNYYCNSANQSDEEYVNNKVDVVFTAKTSQSLQYNFDIMVCGFLAE